MRLARARAPSGAARVGRGRACGRARGLESQNTVHQGPSSKRTEGQAGPADAMFYSVLFLNSDPGPDIPPTPRWRMRGSVEMQMGPRPDDRDTSLK